MTTQNSIFQKSFDVPGMYFMMLKSGLKIAYSKRSALWKDKANCEWVSLELFNPTTNSDGAFLFDGDFFFDDGEIQKIVEVRYNEISAVLE